MYRSEPVPTIKGLRRIEVVLPDQLVAGVERAAATNHTTFVEILRRLIDQGLPPDYPKRGADTKQPNFRQGGQPMTTQLSVTILNTGAPVFSRDGKRIGTVKDVSGTSFKIGSRWRQFWLSNDMVDYVDASGARLFIAREDVNAYRLPRPAAMEPYSDPAEDQLISDSEKQEQRERMERELAETRWYHHN